MEIRDHIVLDLNSSVNRTTIGAIFPRFIIDKSK